MHKDSCTISKNTKKVLTVSVSCLQGEMMDDEGIEEGEIADSDSDVENIGRQEFNRIPWPPGKWRLGIPYSEKSEFLFLRFATKGK